MGIGDWAQSPIPNPQSPLGLIPNNKFNYLIKNNKFINYKLYLKN